MLIGRSAACFGAGAMDPEQLGSAIATLAVVRIAEGSWLVDGANNGQEWHVRLNAPFAVIDGMSAGGALGRGRGDGSATVNGHGHGHGHGHRWGHGHGHRYGYGYSHRPREVRGTLTTMRSSNPRPSRS